MQNILNASPIFSMPLRMVALQLNVPVLPIFVIGKQSVFFRPYFVRVNVLYFIKDMSLLHDGCNIQLQQHAHHHD